MFSMTLRGRRDRAWNHCEKTYNTEIFGSNENYSQKKKQMVLNYIISMFAYLFKKASLEPDFSFL
jgi:hypothetical protein